MALKFIDKITLSSPLRGEIKVREYEPQTRW